MAKKIKKVSTKTLRDFCKPEIKNNVVLVSVKDSEGKDFVFEVKRSLTVEEAIRFVNDVVKNSIMSTGEALMPTGRSMATAECLLTYYANFELPDDLTDRYELLTWATPITDAILREINKDQWSHISLDIINGIDFEKQKAIAARTNALNEAVSVIKDVSGKMDKMFEGLDGDAIAKFVSTISSFDATIRDVKPDVLADAMIKSATT